MIRGVQSKPSVWKRFTKSNRRSPGFKVPGAPTLKRCNTPFSMARQLFINRLSLILCQHRERNTFMQISPHFVPMLPLSSRDSCSCRRAESYFPSIFRDLFPSFRHPVTGAIVMHVLSSWRARPGWATGIIGTRAASNTWWPRTKIAYSLPETVRWTHAYSVARRAFRSFHTPGRGAASNLAWTRA